MEIRDIKELKNTEKKKYEASCIFQDKLISKTYYAFHPNNAKYYLWCDIEKNNTSLPLELWLNIKCQEIK